MGRVAGISLAAASASAPTMALISGGAERDDEVWRSFDNSVNAVSFGFVATAILISMFLVMAVFERFLRPRSTDAPAGGGGRGRTPDGDDEATMRKPEFPSPKVHSFFSPPVHEKSKALFGNIILGIYFISFFPLFLEKNLTINVMFGYVLDEANFTVAFKSYLRCNHTLSSCLGC